MRGSIRQIAEKLGHHLDRATKGRLTPDMVTIFGFAMHVPIAYLIATGHFLWAAGLLIVFGLFDTLDGGLARAQGKSSARGMLLDASTDRFKEVLLYTGAGYWLATGGVAGFGSGSDGSSGGSGGSGIGGDVGGSDPALAAWAVAACGASLCVSYVKAKGEAAVAASEAVRQGKRPIPHATLNRMFADGLLTFEMRMAVLVVGLLFDRLALAVVVVAVLAGITAVQRLVRIRRQL